MGPSPSLDHGAYLTDGACLYRVLDADGERVALEDCRYPDRPAVWWTVLVVCRKMRRVDFLAKCGQEDDGQ